MDILCICKRWVKIFGSPTYINFFDLLQIGDNCIVFSKMRLRPNYLAYGVNDY